MAAPQDENRPEETDFEEATTSEPEPSDGVVKLFLGGLSWSLTEDQIKEYFESNFGPVKDVVIMRDKYTNRPRGFGFLTLEDEDAAARICQGTHVLDGRQIDAKRSLPQSQKPKLRKLFVGGLAPETTEESFREYFGQFGDITEAQIMQDHTSGRSRGFGFITYEEEAAIEKVFAKGRMHELAGKNVEVKRATPKGSGALARSQGWRGYEARPERGPLEPPGMRSQPQGWTAYGSPPGMMSAYGIAGYQVPYDAYGAYGGRQHMQHLGAYRHGGYQYIMHPLHSQGRGG
ncbi:g8843 [Coccomyxa elongata]